MKQLLTIVLLALLALCSPAHAQGKLTLATGTCTSAPGAGKGTLCASSSTSHMGELIGTGAFAQFIGGSATYSAQPSDPTGTASTTLVMAGIAGTITPATTGRILILATGNLTNTTATAGDGAKVQISYGTGSAPANAAALTGTQCGNVVTSVLERATANDLQSFPVMCLVTGLTIGTAYWLDLAEAAIVGGTGTVKNISFVAIEI